MVTLLFLLAIVLLFTNILTLLWFKLRAPKTRKDLQEILGALKDFEEKRGCLVEIRRVDSADLFIWGRGR